MYMNIYSYGVDTCCMCRFCMQFFIRISVLFLSCRTKFSMIRCSLSGSETMKVGKFESLL